MASIPNDLQPFLASSPVTALDSERDKRYIINNLLQKSDLFGWQWGL